MYTLHFLLKESMSFVFQNLLTFILLTFFLIMYIRNTIRINYFRNRGIKYMEPNMFVGNLWPRLSHQRSYYETQLDIYNYFKGERYGGYFEGNKRLLYIQDPDLIKYLFGVAGTVTFHLKAITIKDFDHFVNKMFTSNNNKRYLQRIILDLKDDEWKSVRTLITPTFSSFRLKNMYPLMQESSRKLLKYMDNIDCSEVEVKDLMGYFTLDVIGACAFGIDSCFVKDRNSDFIKAAKNFNKLSLWNRIIIMTETLLSPAILKYMKVSLLNQDAGDVLVGILKKAKAERRSTKSERSDFLQLLINAAIEEQNEKKGSIELDDDTIDAQALIFLLAGYETSSTLLSFAIYILATQPEIQDRLRDHVQDVTRGEDITYNHLAELDYLEGVLLETSRLYPPFQRLARVCGKPYTLPGTNVRIEVGDIVAISAIGIHMDPELYPEPEKFIPERFTREERMKRPSHHYLTFGSGPRICIGMRFAMMSMKHAMGVLLRNYKFSPCPKTDIPLKITTASHMLQTENGIWVRMDKINQSS